MKKRTFILLFLLALLLAGCGRQAAVDSRESYPYDQTVGGNIGFVATDHGTYFVRSPEWAQDTPPLICVCPKGSDTFIPLCGKPNCGHDDRNCNAATESGLGFYKNRLYTLSTPVEISDAYSLVSLKPDGSDRRVETGIPCIGRGDGSSQSPDFSLFHSGKLILFYYPEEDQPYEQQITRVQILDLETGQISEPFADLLTPELRIDLGVRPVGQYLYCTHEYRQPEGTLEYWRCRMNMDTGAIEKLFPVTGSRINLEESYTDEEKIYWLEPGEGFCEYDLATGQTVNKGLPVADLNGMSRDGDWIYATSVSGASYEHCTLYILNHDYQVVETLTLPDYSRLRMVDDRYLYFGNFWLHGEDTVSAIADRKQIGMGNLTLTIQREVPNENPFASDKSDGVESELPADPSFYGETQVSAQTGDDLTQKLGVFFLDTSQREDGSRKDLLYCIPQGEKMPAPACRKPDCDHTGPDCGAYYPTLVWDAETNLQAMYLGGAFNYGERVYLFTAGEDYALNLYSVDPETWERRLEKRYPVPETEGVWDSHLAWVSLMGDAMLLTRSLSGPEDCPFYEESLVDLATLEPLGAYAPVCARAGDTVKQPSKWVGNVGFASAERQLPGGESQEWLAEVDRDTWEVRMVVPVGRTLTSGENTLRIGTVGFTADRDKIYYLLENGDFHEYDRKTGGDASWPCPRKDASSARYADDLILVTCYPGLLDHYETCGQVDRMEQFHDGELVIFSRDYQLLDTVNLPGGSRVSSTMVTPDYLYCRAADGLYALDRTQIGSGALEWEKVM